MEPMQDHDFATHAQQLIDTASPTPWSLRDGRQTSPRQILAELAAVATRTPVTGREIDYTQTLRECFDALAAGDNGGDPDLHTLGLMLAMMSLDRGGHIAQADACENALQYMASLPAWREANIAFGRNTTT